MANKPSTFDIHMEDVEETEEMEIEFTPVENKKKARSPFSSKKSPPVAMANHFEALSDDVELVIEPEKATINQKKARTKSKSPRRPRKSKSPNPRAYKNKQPNELDDHLLAEAI